VPLELGDKFVRVVAPYADTAAAVQATVCVFRSGVSNVAAVVFVDLSSKYA